MIMATETNPASLASQTVILAVPAPGQTVTVQVLPNQVIEVPFDIAEANVTVAGDDLRIEFPGQAVLILTDFAAMAEQGTSPLMIFADGSVIAGDILLTALTAELPEVAAGAAGASGGAGEYRDDMGNLIDTIDRLGVQDPDPFAREVALVLEDEQLLIAPSIDIVDPDNPDAGLANIRLPEGDVALWGIKISDAPGGSTITLALSDGTAELGKDYTLDNFVYRFAGQDGDWIKITGPIAIPEGDSLLLVKTDTIKDNVFEGDETFILRATLTAQGTDYTASAVATIYDDNPPAFSINDVTVSEADGTITFTVTKTGATALASSVDYSVAPNSAVTPDDYTAGTSPLSGTLTFAAGETTKTITLNITNDMVYEPTETFYVNLSNAVAATIADDQGIGTITDNDAPEPRILDGVMKTNTNVQNQFITMTFAEVQEPLHAAAKIYDLSLQGQQGSVVQDVGFNIDPNKHYNVALEASAGTKAIVTELTLEGVVIQGSGNAQLEINNTAATNSTSTAITAVIDPETPPALQAKTVSIDGDAGNNNLSDTTPGTFTYLFGADGADTLTGSSGQEILNGGGGIDTLNGGGGNDILVYDSQNNDVIRGGDGFDLLRVDDGALYLSQQGSSLPGNLLGPADNVVINLSGKNIQGIEGILITEEAGASTLGTDPNDDVGTTIILNAQDVLDYTNGDTIDDNLLYILGSPGDVVQLGGATWEFVGTLPADSQGQAFSHWTAQIGSETANVYVETEVQVQTI